MKRNKTLAFALLLACGQLSMMTLQAEETAVPPKRERPGSDRREVVGISAGDIYEKLGLNDEQKAKLKAADEELQKQKKALLGDATLKVQDKTAKLSELGKAHKAKVKEILTPEQFEKYQKHMDERRPVRPDNRVRVPNVG